MGENEGWAESGGPLPNGLLPGAGPVLRTLDSERWSRAEDRTAELIACIQPNQLSEERRNAVAEYVQRLITKCFPCQVCTFGSVPLKTYLPDGDIDLTAFSHDQNLKDNWANQVRDMLQNEEKNENAEFHVKEVQYIQAEVKIIKCLVENIVVDISFNQVGGLCTLCFLDEVDHLINQNHLFKRSIILIKAWCYYESRILGAHHGLISTYALETLVLYIFHVFNNTFHGPLEVLYRFLEFFSNFDWDNFCVSLWGPVPISSLPDMTAEPPRKDSGELLLSKLFLDACSSVYAVFPGGQENNGQPFISKHFNVIDPLRVNNNLGRSVSKGNFFRIRSAFAFGAKRLARLLDCPEENLSFEVNQFFMNTWDRHGSGHRPDAPGVDSWRTGLPTPGVHHENSNSGNILSRNNVNQNKTSSLHGTEDRVTHGHGVASRTKSLKSQTSNSSGASDQIRRDNTSDWVLVNEESQGGPKANRGLNDVHGRLLARTSSSPELTVAYNDFPSQTRHNRKPEAINTQVPSKQSLDMHADGLAEEFQSTSGGMNQEEQDIVNMMASASLQGLNEQFHIPFNLNSGPLPFSIPPSFLASMGYAQRNFPGFVPANNIPLFDPSFSNLQFHPNLLSPRYFPGAGVASPSEAPVEQGNDKFGSAEVMIHEELDNDFWHEQNVGYNPENGKSKMSDDKRPASVSGLKYIPPHRLNSSDKASRVEQKHPREKHGPARQNTGSISIQDDRISEIYAEERSVSSRFSTATHSNSLRSRASSESSWDGSSAKTPKSTKERRGKKILPSAELASGHTGIGKGKVMSDHMANQLENENAETLERNYVPESLSSLQIPSQNMSSGFEVARVSGPDSVMPFAPMLVGPGGSTQRMNDNSGLVAFYPTGPPIPFLTMLPVYNIPPETSTSESSSGHFVGDDTLENSDSGHNLSPEGYDHLEDLNPLNSLRATATAETSEKKKPDILNSDFASHWQNLQFGRFCQNPQHNGGPLIYPSPVMVPPAYLQGGRFPYDSSGRPFSANTNLFSQLMTSYGQRLVPVAPLQSVSNRPYIYQNYMDGMPRFRSGTGTYLPNPVPIRERNSSSTRRGNYSNYDRNENYGDKEGNWNSNTKSRGSVRNHGRSRSDKSNSRTDRLTSVENRADHSWNSYRHEALPSYQPRNGQLSSSFNQNVPQTMAYNMYPLSATNPNGVTNGPSVPPFMMLYPFDHNNAVHGEQLEFGSLGPMDLPGIDEHLQLNEGTRARMFQEHRIHGGSDHHSSPDQPSSPRQQRRG
ncbi:nucleotidyltransferases [Striga hermonthica]|uniref:Nucleotidyltransferases n=1 Tax=Striga hermonthica TaxID=68872 RepID=A0A9N7RHW7_STRHE|nr:nucleotidyltransferases [Striga hermonthica]